MTELAGWTTDAPAVAHVDNVTGLRGVVTGLTPGTSTILARFLGTGSSTVVTVTP